MSLFESEKIRKKNVKFTDSQFTSLVLDKNF